MIEAGSMTGLLAAGKPGHGDGRNKLNAAPDPTEAIVVEESV